MKFTNWDYLPPAPEDGLMIRLSQAEASHLADLELNTQLEEGTIVGVKVGGVVRPFALVDEDLVVEVVSGIDRNTHSGDWEAPAELRLWRNIETKVKAALDTKGMRINPNGPYGNYIVTKGIRK